MTQNSIDIKITESQEILRWFGLPLPQQNKICALTLLALCQVKPEDSWESATAKSVTLSKDIIEFVNKYYNVDYKPNTRESFRKIALKPFLENNIVSLNPDDPYLRRNSSKTHYQLSVIALQAVRQFNTKEWQKAIDEFKLKQFPQNAPSQLLLRKINIQNFKSILNDKIELGRFNVFIGVNGCGKSNILEAIATASASIANDLNFEGLYGRGVRIARPDLMVSSFHSMAQKETIEIKLTSQDSVGTYKYDISLIPENSADIYTRWRDVNHDFNINPGETIGRIIQEIIGDIYHKTFKTRDYPNYNQELIISEINDRISQAHIPLKKDSVFNALLCDFAIYNLNSKSLRGVIPSDSRKTPLGVNGEGLDHLISNFNAYENSVLRQYAMLFDWLDSIISKENANKLESLRAGVSTSTLYFTDKFMQKQNNTFSAENSNEGILHILFYIALFISNKTPRFFAIDNIETALNPKLCQKLIVTLVALAKERGKQVLVTTHNPAILDGLNLFDDEQRLFVVYRDSGGKTLTRRIEFKDNPNEKNFKLSSMWLNGSLGAIPKHF